MHRFTVIEVFNADGIVNAGPCLVYGVTLAADGANADVDVYDGVNANAKKVSHLEALSGTSFSLPFAGPVIFHRGVYLDVNATTSFVTVEYKPLSKKALAEAVLNTEA